MSDRLPRLLSIYHRLLQGEKITLDFIMEYGEISRRTVFQDIKILKDYGISILYDKVNKMYYMDPINRDRILSTRSDEIMQLAVAIKSPLQDEEKLERSLKPLLKEDQTKRIDKLKHHIHFKIPHSKINPDIWQSIGEGILDKKKLYLKYKSLSAVKVFHVHPYDLFFAYQSWYLIGFCEEEGNVRVFRLNRIVTSNASIKTFTVQPSYDFERLYGKKGFIRETGKTFTAEIWFDKEYSRVINEVEWCESQKITLNPDESLILKGKFYDEEELIHWALGFGIHAKILKPERLVQSMKNIVQDIQKLY